MTLEELRAEYDLSYDGDAWGHCMHWWFVVADELYFRRETSPPDHWQFRPSPLGGQNEEDDYAVEAVRDVEDPAILIAFGEELNAEAKELRLAGRDY